MVITNGNIKSLIRWFKSSTNTYDLLLLFVAGSKTDKTVLSDILEFKETIHSVTGKKIAFIIFTDNDDNYFAYKSNRGYNGFVLPGRILENSNELRFFTPIDKIQDTDDIDQFRIMRRSISISSEICNFFNISPNETPCFLILNKYQEIPWIIRTEGIVGIETYLSFFKNTNQFLFDNKIEIETCMNEIKRISRKIHDLKKGGYIHERHELSSNTSLMEYSDDLATSLKTELTILEKKIKNFLDRNNIAHSYIFERINEKSQSELFDSIKISSKKYQNFIKLENGNKVEISHNTYSRIYQFYKLKNKIRAAEKSSMDTIKELSEKNNELRILIENKTQKHKEQLPMRVQNLQKEINQLKNRIIKIDEAFNKHNSKYERKFRNKYVLIQMEKYFDKVVDFSKKIKELIGLGKDLSSLG